MLMLLYSIFCLEYRCVLYFLSDDKEYGLQIVLSTNLLATMNLQHPSDTKFEFSDPPSAW